MTQEKFEMMAREGGRGGRTHDALVSVVVLGENANAELIGQLEAAMAGFRHETVVVYARDQELAVVEALKEKFTSMRLVKSARSGAQAYDAGFGATAGDVVVTINSDGKDAFEKIAEMALLVRGGCAAVVGRRGRWTIAGAVLWSVGGMNAMDVITSFRAFDANLLDELEVESALAEVAPFELTVQAHQRGLHVEEIVGGPGMRGSMEGRGRWVVHVLQAPLLVWGTWLMMVGIALAHVGMMERRITLGHLVNVAMLAAGAFAMTLAVRRVRVRMRFADAFLSIVLLNPLMYRSTTMEFDRTLMATGILGLMTGAIIAMKRDHLPRYFAVAALALALTRLSDTFMMVIPALVIWLVAAGFMLARGPRTGRTRGYVIMAAGEAVLVLFGIACLLEEPTKTPPSSALFSSIVGFADFPLLVLAIVMLSLGWRKGPRRTGLLAAAPPHFAGMLALLVGLLTMLLNNFQSGSLPPPGSDQTVLVLCLVYVVFSLHGPRRFQWVAPPLLLAGAAAYTIFR